MGHELLDCTDRKHEIRLALFVYVSKNQGFKTRDNEQISVRVASSFISPEQAAINLKRELGKRSFDENLAQAKERWSMRMMISP